MARQGEAWDSIWLDARLATMAAGGAAYGAVEDAALAVAGGRIAWLGPQADLPGAPADSASSSKCRATSRPSPRMQEPRPPICRS